MNRYLDLLTNHEKYMIFTDMENLDIYCEYLFNDNNKYITHANIMNLYDLINYMDGNAFSNNDAKTARYKFLKYYLEAKVEKGMIRRHLCTQYALDNIPSRYHLIIKREIINSITPDSLVDNDIKSINAKVFADLNYIFMHKYKVPLMEIFDDIENNRIRENSEYFLPFFQSIVTDLTNAKRRSVKSNSFNLTDPLEFKNFVTSSYERLNSPQSFLKTGFKGLNLLLNGGFENGRLYNVIGVTGGFKSGFLLNMMKTVKLNNKNMDRRRSQKKRKTILFVSQENNLFETLERIFNIFATVDRISNFTVEQVLEMLDKGGFGIVSDEYDIDIEFRYYPNDDIGVPELRGLIEELENANKEVIMLIQDYIERLKPPSRSVDKRIQLGDVYNQLHDLAVDKDIPVLTASQFNREGTGTFEKIVEEGMKKDGVGFGMKDISESYGMLKNIDVNLGIFPIYHKEENRFYLYIKKLKFRGSDDGALSAFYQPFVGVNSKIMLEEDGGSKHANYKTSLMGDGMYRELVAKPSMVERKKLVPETFSLEDEKKDVESIYEQFKEMEQEAKGIRLIFNDKFLKLAYEVDKKRKAMKESKIKIELLPEVRNMIKNAKKKASRG